MRLAPALSVASLVLVTLVPLADARGASPDSGGDRAVAATRKTLEAARENLAKAVQRIEKDPPSTEDLDAAHAAVGALKSAIDSGAEHEQKDLDYAKAALSARKELRTQREYVDQRRSKVHIFNHRRTIDRALADLDDRARRVEGAKASAKDFDDARAAAKALRKAVDEARPFAKQDQSFATYVAETDAKVARQEKAIDDRSTQLAAEDQRAILQEGRHALSSAMAALSKGASDAQFENADRAASALSKRLEDGKAFEAKDKAYRADAERARTELAQAKKRMEEFLSETGLARLKAEIGPAYKDLAAAARAVRAKNPTPDQLAEARTAAIVVRKLVDKFQPQAARSQAFGQYINEVKKTLSEVEAEIEGRHLDSARSAVVQALRLVEKRTATDESFAEATTALSVLEKTLETVHADGAMAKPVSDARTLLRDGRASLAKRRVEVDVQRQRAQVEEARKGATAAMNQTYKADASDEQLQEAEAAVHVVGLALEKGSDLTKKDREYADYDREVRKRIAELNEGIAKRRVEVAVKRQRSEVEAARRNAAAAMNQTYKANVTDEQLQAAEAAVQQVAEAVEKGSDLTKKDREYGTFHVEVKKRVAELTEGIAKRRLEVDLQRQRVRVEEARTNASALVTQLQQPTFGSNEVKEAEAAVNQIGETLEKGAALIKKDREYAAYDREVRKRIAELNEKIAKRKITLAASDGRTLLTDAVSVAKAKLQATKEPAATDADLAAAAKSVEAVREALEARTSLEEQDKSYAAQSNKAREDLSALKTELAFANKAQALRKRMLDASSAGAAASNSAAAAKDHRAQRDLHQRAVSQFGACESAGTSMLEGDRALAGVAMLVEGRPATPKEAIALCAQRSAAAKQLLNAVEGLIRFEEGPRKSFEEAKRLLDRDKKGEALEQFLECVGSGRILLQRNPELKDRRFEVAGASMTLAEVTDQCTKHRDALQAKK